MGRSLVGNWMNKSIQFRSAALGHPSSSYWYKITLFNQLFQQYNGHFDSTKIRSTRFLKANRWIQYTSTSTNKWLDEICYIHKVEYSLAIEKSEVLIHATAWTDLENTMVSEKIQLQKTTCPKILFICNVQEIYRNIKQISEGLYRDEVGGGRGKG